MTRGPVRARFVGRDGSFGYRHGYMYDLMIDGNRIVRPTPCPYGSVEAFLRNWQPLDLDEKE